MPQGSTGHPTQRIGVAVPGFHLRLINGGTVSLQMLLEGRQGAAIVFWSGICSHCAHYDRYLNVFAACHPELGFVTIASRKGETPDTLLAIAAARELTFPILCDPESAVAEQWFTRQTPRVFLVDSLGRLIYRGAIDNYRYPDDLEYVGYLEPAIAQFLSGTSVSRSETAGFGCAIQSVYYNLPKAL